MPRAFGELCATPELLGGDVGGSALPWQGRLHSPVGQNPAVTLCSPADLVAGNKTRRDLAETPWENGPKAFAVGFIPASAPRIVQDSRSWVSGGRTL